MHQVNNLPLSSAALPHSIALLNASNLRDLGGYPTANGRRVRRGLVFRAPALVALAPSDEAEIARLNLRTLCDLRGVRERAAHRVVIAGTTSISLPIEPSVGASLKDIVLTGKMNGTLSPGGMKDLLREAYAAYALQNIAQYSAFFQLLLQPEALPLVLHCSAGKDRTGFGAALLLTALGVAWPDVLHDYLATNTLWRREIARNFDLPEDIKTVLFSVDETFLAAAFDAARAAYGSIDAYLARAIGLHDRDRATLVEQLTED